MQFLFILILVQKKSLKMLQKLGMISDKCDEWSLPLVAMMYLRGENIKNPHDPEIVAQCYEGSEAGADIVKTVYTGDVNSFKRVVEEASRACGNCWRTQGQ